MCLSSLSRKSRLTKKDSVIGWKVMAKSPDGNTLHPLIRNCHTVIHTDEWNVSSRVFIWSIGKPPFTYTSGFHILLKKKDCAGWIRHIFQNANPVNVCIAKVEASDITAVGIDESGLKTLVAGKMRILKVEDYK